MRLEYSRGPIWLWLAAALLLAPGGVGMSAASAALGDEDDPTVGASAAAPAAAETPGEDAVDDSNVPSEEAPPGQPAADSDEPAADDVAPPNEQSADETQAEPDDADAPAEMPAEGDSDAPAPLEPADAAREEPKFPSATLDADSLKRVRPHHTTRDQLHIEWGPPRGIERIAGGVRETYEETAFDRVRVTIINDKVESLAIQLETPVALEALAKPLEIEGLDPVDVFDEQGQLLGRAYPERGVLCGFAPGPGPPQVFQVVVEAIDAQPFLARAEVRLHSRYTDCMSDLKRALELAPNSGRVHWLHAELMLASGGLEQALKSARKAVELQPKEWTYHLTLAKVLAAGGDYPQAIQRVRDVAESAKPGSIVVAQAFCQWGDYVGASQEHDYPQAIKHHMQAISVARPLAESPAYLVRRAAKEMLVDANLAVAHDVGWGHWQQKVTAVPKWIELATVQADSLVADDRGAPEVQFRVQVRALAALAGMAEPADAGQWTRGAMQLGQRLIADSKDPIYTAHVAWHLGLALNDAAEIETARNQPDKATELGTAALQYLEQGERAGKQLPTHDFVRGRLCYRLGAILAIERADHKQALAWYDRAVPLLESPVPAAAMDSGKQGETFVSMAVSYWEVNQRKEALRLTNQGVKLMEQAARDGLMSKAALAIPYANLASMHEQLGNAREAKKYAGLAGRQQDVAPK